MQTSEQVAAWGEQWLQDWIADPGISEHDREVRVWLAEGWREWSLEKWANHLRDDERLFGCTVDEFNTHSAANAHAALYRREGNGLLIWRMFAEYRHGGLPVPEFILEKFDEWAAALDRASGVSSIARAIEMTSPRGGPQGALHLNKVERQRAIVSQVMVLIKHGMKPSAARQRVASEKRLTVAAVKSACDRWMKPRTGRGAEVRAEQPELKALRTLGRRSGT